LCPPQTELYARYDQLEQAIRSDKHTLQDQMSKMASNMSDSHHALADAHRELHRGAEEMLRETKRDRGRLEEVIKLFKEDAQEAKR
jgi:vacuolar-type H+-ATPase catalytic subunit A/Vma1